jgi:hypothetical protein
MTTGKPSEKSDAKDSKVITQLSFIKQMIDKIKKKSKS